MRRARALTKATQHGGRCHATQAKAFTLIELLAVVVVVSILAAIALRVAGYAQQRANQVKMSATFAAIQGALELYQSDHGYYPVTSEFRISADGRKESTNNWYLYRALSGTCVNCAKRYLTLTAPSVHVSRLTGLTNVFDAFDQPFNYYNSPATAYFLYAPPASVADAMTGYTLGGQKNKTLYDLFSYGIDGMTYAGASGNITPSSLSSWVYGYRLPASAEDDIWP